MAATIWCIFALALVSFPYLNDGAKILVVFPFPTRSHNILGEGINRILLEAGHEITYVTPYPKKESIPNLRYVGVSESADLFSSRLVNLRTIINKEAEKNDFKHFMKVLTELANITLTNENMQKLLLDPKEAFDLVIIEWMFGDVYSGLSALYDCPFIWFSSADVHWMVLELIDEAPNPAYVPESLSTYLPPFTFYQRVEQLLKQKLMGFFRDFYLLRNERQLYEKIFVPLLERRGKNIPSFDELRYNASLMIGNSHVSLGKSIRLPQNYKPIGGYHIDPNVKPLPEDLKKIMDGAKNGVIYFSMGSHLKSKDYPEELRRRLLEMFGGLKYTVIWKFEEKLTGLPKNVHVVQWAPQTSILAHPNCKLFITHGGLLSLLETVHFGIPIIGIPVLADQNINVELAVKRGFALMVELSYEMVDDLKIAVGKILDDPKYAETVKELNLIYHDRPVPPSTELVHWVGHVLRTKGAAHMRSAALLVPWYQKHYLDLLALVLIVIYIFIKLVKFLCCSRKKVSSKKKNN